jgi:signal transduction histidine kinase
VNQAVLLRFRPDELAASTQEAEVLLAYGVKLEQVPGPDGLLALQHKAGQQREIAPGARTEPDPAPWVRLVLPLLVGSRWVGMCLLGRKDPDDFYTPDEITLLQALMTQTALALVHIEQAARLRLYYQADIQRQEDERQNLARELHDHLLGQMALLIQHAGDSQESEAFLKAYRSAVQDIRSIISGLRPAALTYGLVPALEELTDELNDTPIDGGPPVEVWCSLKSEQARYPEDVELHLYRIVQQACQNALQHAAPGEIKLRGVLDENGVVLSVTDDGVGFVTPRTPDLAALLAHRQYGLVGMIERAGLIQAELTIDSAPGQGTRISITWQAHPAGL